jgi:hypothetical protein
MHRPVRRGASSCCHRNLRPRRRGPGHRAVGETRTARSERRQRRRNNTWCQIPTQSYGRPVSGTRCIDVVGRIVHRIRLHIGGFGPGAACRHRHSRDVEVQRTIRARTENPSRRYRYRADQDRPARCGFHLTSSMSRRPAYPGRSSVTVKVTSKVAFHQIQG